jgi:DNA-directed RNA polymerase sigma subunit (sigma70/sigma32)
MNNIIILTKEFILEELNYIIDNNILSEKELLIIKLRYGIEANPKSLREISRIANIKLKNVKKEVDEAERKIFNILKKKI